MKWSIIQRENVSRGHTATTIATNIHKAIPFHGQKPGDVVSIRQSPHRQLSAVRQTRPHSDAAAVGLSKVSKVIQSGLCLPFCCKCFHGSVSSKSPNSYRFLKIKCDSLCTDPLASSNVDGCNGNKVSWYPVLSKFITYIREDSLQIRCTKNY